MAVAAAVVGIAGAGVFALDAGRSPDVAASPSAPSPSDLLLIPGEPYPPIPDQPVTKASASDVSGALCAQQYSPAGLRERSFAFDGTVVSATPIEGLMSRTTFRVSQWFAGGSGPTVTVPMWPAVVGREVTETNVDPGDERATPYRVGTRLLVTGERRSPESPSLADAYVWSCGWTRYYDEQTAAAWKAELSG